MEFEPVARTMVALTVVLTSCASTPEAPATSVEEFTGQVRFPGEFNLFPFPASSSRAKDCISGALPIRRHLRAWRLYDGKFVRITGQMVSYFSLREHFGTEMGWRGSQIANYCGGDVLLAHKIQEISKEEAWK